MADRILDSWWDTSITAAQELAAASDLIEIQSLHDTMPRHLLAQFRCKGLVREADGTIHEADHFVVGMRFPDDYLHRADTFQVLTWLHPLNAWHPNVRPPVICAGHLSPGMPITDLLYQIFEIITFRNRTPSDGLNLDACAWARLPENQHRFPVDRRPLKRRVLTLVTEEVSSAKGGGQS